MMPAKISIIVPIYNVETYLENALTSIQQQSYRNLKVIMVNDGSTDHSVEIAQQFLRDSRFILVSQENQGLSAARNTGLKYVDSEYVYFFDSDDQIAPNLIETVLAVFNKSKVENKNQNHVQYFKCISDSDSNAQTYGNHQKGR